MHYIHNKHSVSFKIMTLKAIAAVLLFITTYLFLISLAIAATLFFGYLGVMLVYLHPNTLTILFALGMISIGCIVLIFLLRFITKKNVVDRSNLQEITREQEPALFQFIENIVNELHTQFPKKIFLSTDVNASVFYDSSFLSLVLPVRKNLQIGYALVNAITITELKAILSHEFGHFSQRSMKVGSWVYYVNIIIYNLLHENNSYDRLVESWGSANNTIRLFVTGAVKIVHGIQWVLRKVYNVVNISYMGLSREMEFHADEVAAGAVGREAIASSLLRLDLASYCFELLLDYYKERITSSTRTDNLYKQHQYLMEFQAMVNKVPVVDHFPQIRVEDLSKYNKSRLVIKDQWASHPGITERIENVRHYPGTISDVNNHPATSLFKQSLNTEIKLTDFLFDGIHYPDTVQYISLAEFSQEYESKYKETVLGDIFNSYYDNKNPGRVDLDLIPQPNEEVSLNASVLFSNEYTDLVYTIISMEGDKDQIKQISLPDSGIQSFDYNGIRYRRKDCDRLLTTIEEECRELKAELLLHDQEIHSYFYYKSLKTGLNEEYLNSYKAFRQYDQEYEEKVKAAEKAYQLSSFVYVTTPYDAIQRNLVTLSYAEEEFKHQIRTLMDEEQYQLSFSGDARSLFRNYISKEWVYFEKDTYDTKALDLLFNCLDRYTVVLNKTFLRYKKSLLEVMELVETSA